MGTEGEMLQAPTATANHGTRGAALREPQGAEHSSWRAYRSGLGEPGWNRLPLSLHPTSEKGGLVLWVTCIGEFGGAYIYVEGAEMGRSLRNPAQRSAFDDLSQEGNAGFVRRGLVRSRARPPPLYLRDLVDLPGRPARPPQPRTGDDPSPGTHGGDRIAKAHAAHTTLSAELERDTGAGAEELAVRLG
jgi:hypothetical protein